MSPAISQFLVATSSSCSGVDPMQAGKGIIVSIETAQDTLKPPTYERWGTMRSPDNSSSQNKEWGISFHFWKEKRRAQFPMTQSTSAVPLKDQSGLTTDFGEHLVDGLLDMCGGAASPRLALHHPPATHLST